MAALWVSQEDFMFSPGINNKPENNTRARKTTVWLQRSGVTRLCCSTSSVKVCMQTHTCAKAHRGGAVIFYPLSRLYSQSRKIQSYFVTWDHLQEMKRTSKGAGKERIAQREHFQTQLWVWRKKEIQFENTNRRMYPCTLYVATKYMMKYLLECSGEMLAASNENSSSKSGLQKQAFSCSISLTKTPASQHPPMTI